MIDDDSYYVRVNELLICKHCGNSMVYIPRFMVHVCLKCAGSFMSKKEN